MEQNFATEDDAFNFLMNGSQPIAKAGGGSITDNPNFKNWFGESKVVDESGAPLRVYHGTGDAFDSFKTEGGKGKTFGTGTFFSSNPHMASTYATGENKNVMPVHLSLKRPLVVDAEGSNWSQIKQNAKVHLPEVKNFIHPDDVENENLLAALEERDPQPVKPRNFKERKTTVKHLFKGEFDYPDDTVSTDDIARWARKNGHDGVIIKNVIDRGPSGAFVNEHSSKPSDAFVAFHPHQIKSAIGNEGTFDPTDPRINKAEGGSISDSNPTAKAIPQSSANTEPTLVNGLGHYSEAIEQLKKLPQQKGTVGQFRKAIASKVSPEEFKWSNFDDHFTDENAKVDKSQLINHFTQNLPKLKETVRRDNAAIDSHLERLAKSAAYDPDLYDQLMGPKAFNFDSHEYQSDREQYVLEALKNDETNYEDMFSKPVPKKTKYHDYQSGGNNYREILLHVDHPETQYQSSHWDEPNVLAHLRLNDHMGPNGEKLLHVEEAQSDWGQDARQKGMKENLAPKINEKRKRMDEINDIYSSAPKEDREKLETEYDKIQKEIKSLQEQEWEKEKSGSVAPAPFIHNTSKWTELAMKRVLKEAAEGGYDGVTLSSGDEQKQRWRGAAGADGLKSFYDDVLPKTLEKVAKAHDKDAKVASTAEMSTSEYEKLPDHKKAERLSEKLGVPMYGQEALDWFSGLHPTTKRDLIAKVGGDANPRPFLPVTPAMKASVKRGQRMFKDGGKVKSNLPSDTSKAIIEKALTLTNGNRSTASSNLTAAKGA